jgi:hypothetical protein
VNQKMEIKIKAGTGLSGEDDSCEGAKAVGKIEGAIPAKDRPFADLSVQFKSRQKLICDRWKAPLDRLTV